MKEIAVETAEEIVAEMAGEIVAEAGEVAPAKQSSGLVLPYSQATLHRAPPASFDTSPPSSPYSPGDGLPSAVLDSYPQASVCRSSASSLRFPAQCPCV